MKKILIVITAALLSVMIFASCAPSQSQTSATPQQSAETEKPEIKEESKEEVKEENAAEKIELEGTEWRAYKVIEADGSEEDMPVDYSYSFKADGKATESMGDEDFEGTYEIEGNGVIIQMDERTMLGVVENGEMQVFEGKGAYVFKKA